MTRTNKVWLMARALIFPLLAIAPFFLVKDRGASCLQYSKEIVGQFTHQSFGQGTVYGMRVYGEPHYFGALLWLILIAFVAVAVLKIGPKQYQARRDFTKQQVVVSVITTVMTLPIYYYFYLHSQLKHPSTWWCDSQSHLHGGVPAAAHFGFGLAPVAMAFFTLLYLLSALVPFVVLRHSRKRIGGRKKNDLFQ